MRITRPLLLSFLLAFAGQIATAQTPPEEAIPAAIKTETVRFETTLGDIDIELFAEEAPLSAANFLQYVQSGFYDGVIFHRRRSSRAGWCRALWYRPADMTRAFARKRQAILSSMSPNCR